MLSRTKRLILILPPLTGLAYFGFRWIMYFSWFCTGNFSWLFPVADGPVPNENEMVMTPGMKIIAMTPAANLTVTAGNGLKRSYTWNGGTRSIELWPRPDRWYGSLGAYFPGPGNHWFVHDKVSRCVAEEGQLNFSTVEKAMKWLSETPGFQPRIYRNDGLTVWVDKNSTLGVDVFQIYIKGKKPSRLPAATDHKIKVIAKQAIPATTKAPADSNEFRAGTAAYEAEKQAAADFAPAFFDMAEDFYHEHKYEDALANYDNAVDGKHSAYIFVQRARCLIKLTKYSEAIKSCALASKFDKSDPSIAAVRNEAEAKIHRINRETVE